MAQERLTEAVSRLRKRVFVVLVCVVAAAAVGFYFLIDYMAVASLKQRLASDDPQVRAIALFDAYNRWGGAIIEHVFRELASPSDSVRNAADRILRHHLKKEPDRNLMERLKQTWKDERNDEDLRERALHILAAVAGKEWEDFFFSKEIWELDNPGSMWWDAACRYFERVADEKTYRRLLEWARSNDPQKCYTAVFLARFLFKRFSKEQVERLADAMAPLLVHENLFLRSTAAVTLYKYLEKKHTKYILRALEDRTTSTEAATVREHLLETVKRLRLKEAASRLYEIVLNDVDDRIVQRAAAALATLGSDRYFNLAVNLLENNPNLPPVNMAGVMALIGRIGGSRAVKVLARCLMRQNLRLVKEAGTWLALCEPAAEDAVIAALKAPTAQGRLEAFSILCNWEVKKAIPELVKTALKEQPHIAELMISHLQYFTDTEVVRYLLKAIGRTSGQVKAAIVDVLAFYRTPEAVAAVADALLDHSQEVTNSAQAKLSDIFRSLRNAPDNLDRIIEKVMREYIASLNCPGVKNLLQKGLPMAKSISVARDLLFSALRQLKLKTSLMGTISFRDDSNNIWYALGNLLCDWWTLKLAEKLCKAGLTDLKEASLKASLALQDYDPTGVEAEQNRKVVRRIKAALGLGR